MDSDVKTGVQAASPSPAEALPLTAEATWRAHLHEVRSAAGRLGGFAKHEKMERRRAAGRREGGGGSGGPDRFAKPTTR